MNEQKIGGSIWILGLVSVVAIVGMVAIFGLQKDASSARYADEGLYFDEQGNLLGQAAAVNYCSDSDGGQNFDVAGSVSGKLKNKAYLKSDACADGSTLQEYFCSGTLAASTSVICSYGCSAGKCNQAPAATCFDGIQNQGETGVDCGGPCAACVPAATCSDGIQNQGETGVDCGGPCAACVPAATCSDGIQNQGETGVDCGGPCVACAPAATCSDGIQNQGETGVDCGGPCAACKADLVVLSATVNYTGPLYGNHSYLAQVIVYNAGTLAASGSFTTLYDSEGSTLAEMQTDPLAVGASVVMTESLTNLPCFLSGSVAADGYNQVSESNEGNNLFAFNVNGAPC